MDEHIAFALHITGPRRGAAMDGDADIARALESPQPAWLHLDATHPDTPSWIDTHLAYLDPAIRSALTRGETRPRALRIGNGLMINLRGINFDPSADPEDMVSVRLWMDPARIISLSRKHVASVGTVADMVRAGDGPDRPGSLLAALIEQLTGRIESQVDDLDGRSELLEAAVIADPRADFGPTVSDLRLELTELRLFCTPQRDALRGVLDSTVDWLERSDLNHIAEQLDRMVRVVEELEATREQLTTIRDELTSAADERLNKRLYVLSVISAVFLPLSFLTGLMGINLAGMPGAQWGPAFWVFSGLLAILAVALLLLLRWLRLF